MMDMLEAIAKALGTTAATLMSEAEHEEGGAASPAPIRPLNDEQEMLVDYRRLRGSARSLVRLMVAEMARGGGNNMHQ